MARNIRFHFDEHLDTAIATGLKRRGIDVTTTNDANLLGSEDLSQLAFATTNERVLVTSDSDFLRMNAEGVPHCGIVFVRDDRRQQPGRVIHYLENLWLNKDQSEMQCRVEFAT